MESIYERRILLVDDNSQLRRMVTEILKKEGFLHIQTAADCRECLDCCNREMPELVILDIGLPDGDGFSLMNQIRSCSDVPVLFLSARDEDSDRLLGLGLGADDYITKPFLPRELVLRMSGILRRTYYKACAAPKKEDEILALGNRTVDFGEGVVRDAKSPGTRRLTAKEITILKTLNENRGKIVTFDTLSQAVWGDFYYGYENSLMVHIRRLREKVEEDPSQPRFLTTARGLGYKLEKPPQPDGAAASDSL